MSEPKTYEIGELRCRVLPPVYGVMLSIGKLAVEMQCDDLSGEDAYDRLGANGPRLVACVLCPEGVAPQDRDLHALAEAVRWNATPTECQEMLADFFGRAPGEEVTALAGLTMTLRAMTLDRESRGDTPLGPSSGSSCSSPEETSCGATTSSGE